MSHLLRLAVVAALATECGQPAAVAQTTATAAEKPGADTPAVRRAGAELRFDL